MNRLDKATTKKVLSRFLSSMALDKMMVTTIIRVAIINDIKLGR
jgi:hypothetical protein